MFILLQIDAAHTLTSELNKSCGTVGNSNHYCGHDVADSDDCVKSVVDAFRFDRQLNRSVPGQRQWLLYCSC